MSTPGPIDIGLQLERTTLAWRRSALALAVGSLVAMRLLPELLGSLVWIAPGAIGLVGALWMWWMSRRRHHAFLDRVAAGGAPRIDGAGALCAIAVGTALIGAFGVLVVALVG